MLSGLLKGSKHFSNMKAAALPYVWLGEVQPNLTHGGTATAGGWIDRVLNTKTPTDCAWCDIVNKTTGEFVLRNGVYVIEGSVPGVYCGGFQGRLFDYTRGVRQKMGTSGQIAQTANVFVSIRSEIDDVLYVTSETHYKLQSRCSITAATQGLGWAAGFSDDEIYSFARIWKLQ